MSESLKDLLNQSFDRYPERTAVRVLRQSDQAGDRGLRYVPMTYQQLRDQRDRLASGIAQSGVEKGQRVGILTDGGLEPLLIFLASDALGVSSVPFCNKQPDEILIHNLNHSGIVLLFTDSKSFEQVRRIESQLDRPPRVVLTEGHGDGVESFFDLIRLGGDKPPPDVEVDSEDESKVIYTSGSSGLPKGVVQTHGNLVNNVRSIWDVVALKDDLILFKSAPDYHTLGILNIYYPLAKGWSLDLARSPDRVLSDVRHSEPEGFLTVPLVLDKVYGNVRKEIEAGGIKGKLIGRAVRAKQKIARGKGSVADWLVYKTLGKKVVSQIKEKLAARVGGRLQLLIVGAAKADPEALDFFQDVLDITAFEGYGTTECCPLIAVNTLAGQKTGTVGLPLQEVRLVTEEGEEIGYGDPATKTFRGSGEKVGELWVHGSHVMREYLKDPEQTAKTLVEDGQGKCWYRTGDLFSMDEEGYLTFRGRVGRQFKLRNGEFVNPELLERIYARVPLIEHVLVCGDQSRTFPLPIVTVNAEEARNQTDLGDLPRDDDELRKHPAIAERIRERMLKEATEAGVPGHERPQRVLVLAHPFTEASGTLTKGLKKIVPKEIVKQNETRIAETYDA
jgi:long-chain acyl-CoA synthetase